MKRKERMHLSELPKRTQIAAISEKRRSSSARSFTDARCFLPPPRPGHCGRSICGRPLFHLRTVRSSSKRRLSMPSIIADTADIDD